MRVGLGLFLTGRCNLDCGYCYQRAGPRAGTLPREAAEAAIGTAFALRSDAVEIVFNGGEPLLEPSLLHRCLHHIARVRPPSTRLRLLLATNATLLDAGLIEVLLAHDVNLQVGCHDDSPGGAPAGRTHDILRRLIRDAPELAAHRLSAVIVVSSEQVPGLATRVLELLETGVTDVRLSPQFAPDPGWKPPLEDELRGELDELVDLSLESWLRTGRVPVSALRRRRASSTQALDDDERIVCRAGSGAVFSVDPSGQAWACPRLAPSLQHLPSSAQAATSAVSLGDVRSPDLVDRLRCLAGPVGRLRAFTHRQSKSSQHGPCRDCPVLTECHFCPASTCICEHDADRVPGHLCAFEKAGFDARKQLERRIDDLDLHGRLDRVSRIVDRLEREVLPGTRV